MDFETDTGVRILGLLAGRISHVLRTPLGTAAAVLDDLSKGIALEARDISDARQALERIKDALDNVKACVVDFSIEAPVDLGAIIEASAERCRMSGIPLKAERSGCPVILEQGSPALLRQALCLLADFTHGLPTSGSRRNEDIRTQTVSLGNDSLGNLSFVLSAPGKTHPQLESGAKSCLALAELDHSIQALSLVFADQAAAFHRGSALICQDEHGVLAQLRFAKQGSGAARMNT